MMVKVYRSVLILGLVLVFVVSDAAAQKSKSAGDPVQFSVTAEIEGTDNRDYNTVEDSNFDMYLKPRIDIISNTERTIFDFYYELAYRYRTEPHPTQNEDQYQHNLGLNVKHQIGMASRVRLNERYSLTDDPLVDQAGTTLRRDSSYTLNDIGAGVAVELADNVQGDLYVRNRIKTYDEDAVARESDSDMTSAELKLMRFLQPTLGVYGSLGFAQYGYDSTGNIDRGFDSLSIGAGIDRVLSDYVRAGAQVGFSSVSYADSLIEDEDSPFVDINAQLRPTPRIHALISLKYLIRNADYYPYSSQEATEFYAKVEWTGVERMKFSWWGAYRASTYDDADVSPAVLAAEGASSVAAYMASRGREAQGDAISVMLGASWSYSVAESTQLNVDLTMQDVDSDISTSFTRNAVRVGVARTF